MGSEDEMDPVGRLLYDPDYNRGFARFYTASAATPRYLPLADEDLQFLGPTDATEYVSSGHPEYTTTLTGHRTSNFYAIDDDEEINGPADFMRAPPTAAESQLMYEPSIMGSSNATSVAPSIFTRRSHKTGLSSAPSRRDDRPNFNEALAAAAAAADFAPAVPTAATHELWCELCVLGDCPTTYRIDQTNDWIRHHSLHLKGRYPRRLVCWFCDHVQFEAPGRSNDERYSNFRDRMEHIREHISSDYYTRDDMRPDFKMINHLAKKGIIDNTMRDAALGYTEVPAALRFPGTSASSEVLHQPQRREPGPSLAYDLQRERRQQRPRGGQRRPPPTVQYR